MTKESMFGKGAMYRLKDAGMNVMVEVVARSLFEKGMTAKGRNAFKEQIVGKLKEGEYIALSRLTEILDGYSYEGEGIQGLDVLKNLKGSGMLLVGNHSPSGIMKGFGNEIVISHHVKEQTGEEVKWVQGKEHKINMVTGAFHKMVARSLDTVFLGEDNAYAMLKVVREGKRKKPVGIFPEGRFSEAVSFPHPNFGKLAECVARNRIPLVTVSTWCDENKQAFNACFSHIPVEQVLVEAETARDEERSERLGNLVMWNVAKNMPPEYRGAYADYVPLARNQSRKSSFSR